MALSNESSVSAEPKFPSTSLSNPYQAGYVSVLKLSSAPLPLPLLSRSPTVCFCMWAAVRIFHVAYMKKFLEEVRRRRSRRSDCSVIWALVWLR